MLAILGSVIYTLLTSNYMVIWQKTVYNQTVKKIIFFEQKIKTEGGNNSSRSAKKILYLLYFRALIVQNARWNYLCATLVEYSRLCQPLLSTIFPFIIIVQCYLLYVVVLTEELPPLFKYACILTIWEFNLFLLVVTNQCARVVTLNKRFYQLNRQFYINITKRSNVLYEQYLLKVSLFAIVF